jgi:protease I
MNALIVLAPENFRDEEFDVPKKTLEAAGVKVTVAGPTEGVYRGMLGMTAKPDLIFDHVNALDYDAIILVGGGGSPKWLWDNRKLHNIVFQAWQAGKVVAAICLSTAVLAKANILDGVKATVFPSPDALKVLDEKGVVYVKKPVVVDGKIVTAEGPGAAREFANAILKQLET